ncbi:MAG: hypothetical protein EXR07_06845 [Acetobacteraceae bacterium]|nr:hypothetical protein [Acetobacteraceae bacterium]
MLAVRNDQLEALRAPTQARFEADTLSHLARFYPVDAASLGEAGLLAVIREGQRDAVARAFTLAGDVRRFITLRMVLGSGFPRDPLLPWAARIVAEGQGQPGTVSRLVVEAADYLELTSGEDGQYALRAMLRAEAVTFDQATGIGLETTSTGEAADTALLALLRRIWPQKYRLTRPEQRAAFLRAAATAAAADGLDTPGTARLCTVLMFLLGAGFANDPALPWARAALAAVPDDAPAIDRARALYDAGMAAIARLRVLLPAVGA